MDGDLLPPHGLRNLSGSGEISQFAMSMLHLHVSEHVELSSQAEWPFIGSHCIQVSATTCPFIMEDPANMHLSLPQSVVANHIMGLQQILKGNAVAMVVASRALQYAAVKDWLMGRNRDNTCASYSFVMTLNSLPTNSDAFVSAELFWYQHVNVTNGVMFMYSGTEIKGKVTSVPRPRAKRLNFSIKWDASSLPAIFPSERSALAIQVPNTPQMKTLLPQAIMKADTVGYSFNGQFNRSSRSIGRTERPGWSQQ
eukprot:9277830-Ditylum_brightwellii.AAC.2